MQPIAIIGLETLAPQAKNLREYWENILLKRDSIVDVPASRWNIEDYYDPDPSVPDKTYSKRGGFLPDIEFDPVEFGLPPNILEVTDVAQLLALLAAKNALKDAGYENAAHELRERTGVILGIGGGQKLVSPLTSRLQYPIWEQALKTSGIPQADIDKIIEKMKAAYVPWVENSFPGLLGNIIAGRITNRLDLGGINCVVDAACASSLSALKMAVSELQEHRSDMMLAGGIDTDNTIFMYMSFSKTPAFSPHDENRPFDVQSDGMLIGEAVSLYVLKRLDDAERDGDRIYAVIRGIGTSSDGRFKSIYAPRWDGQLLALKRAYEDAGFSPATLGLVEAHGTGTAAGDLAEVTALNQLFADAGTPQHSIALGSVKSQIGHTKSAAGAVSLTKVALALYHKILPATIKIDEPNPKLGLDTSALYLNTEIRPWLQPTEGYPRRAGISSFGFGGANYHVVLEEYQQEHQMAYRVHHKQHPLLLDAPTPNALLDICQQVLTQLQSERGSVVYRERLDHSLTPSIPQTHARIGLLVQSLDEARTLLGKAIEQLKSNLSAEAWQHPAGIFYRREGVVTTGKVVALFSGQGAQYLNMGRELALNFPVVREQFQAFDQHFAYDGRPTLSQVVFPRPVFTEQEKTVQQQTVTQTENAQPAIAALSMSLYKLWQQAGFVPDFVAGHSFGELTALWAAGIMDDEAYRGLAVARGKAMMTQGTPQTSSMSAVIGRISDLEAELQAFPDVTIANWNSPTQAVIAGAQSALAQVESHLQQKGYRVIPLSVSAAFHTQWMAQAQTLFAAAIQMSELKQPLIPLYSNTTGQRYSQQTEPIRQTLAAHLLHPVRFQQQIEQMYADGGRIFIEFGPKSVLTNLVQDILRDRDITTIALNGSPAQDSDVQLRQAVLQAQVLGLPIQWIDPYQAPTPAAKPTKPGMQIMVNGQNYVSDKTRQHYAAKLAEPHQVLDAQLQLANQQTSQTRDLMHPVMPAAPKQDEKASTQWAEEFAAYRRDMAKAHESFLELQMDYNKFMVEIFQKQQHSDVTSLNTHLQAYSDQQAQVLKMHQQYIDTQSQGIQQLFQVVNGTPMPSTAPVMPQAVQSVVNVPVSATNGTAPVLPQRQVAKVPVVRPPQLQPMQAPVPTVPSAAKPIVTVPSVAKPIVAVTVAAQAAPSQPVQRPVVAPRPVNDSTSILFEIISEKTGYPVDILEPQMDIESDLGIDSIKRVEILSALRSHYPSLPPIKPDSVAQLRTLSDIATHFNAMINPSEAPQPIIVQTVPVGPVSQPPREALNVQPQAAKPSLARPIVAPAPVQQVVVPQPVQAIVIPSVSPTGTQDTTRILFEIISEKTGYPVDILEPQMDIESDLGIDSIKRVEILSALRSHYPSLPPIKPDSVAQLRTLSDIATHFNAMIAPIEAPQPVVIQTVPVAPVSQTPAAPTLSAPTIAAQPTQDTTRILFEIISEKTGYPVDILEPQMDIESDLGIDSIKRVEILSALRSHYPSLPPIKPDSVAQLRTLHDIATHFNQAVQGTSQPMVTVQVHPLPTSNIQQQAVVHKSLPLPDALDWSPVNGSICLITNDGTPLTATVAQRLSAQGWSIVVLDFGSYHSQTAFHHVRLADFSEVAISQALEQVSHQYGQIGAFVHLNPATPDNQAAKAVLQMVFLLAKFLKAPLQIASDTGRACFMSVTRLDGQLGTTGRMTFNPISGGLYGLVKTLKLEWPTVYCKALDLAPSLDVEHAAELILAELYDPSQQVAEVGYGESGLRTTLAGQGN